MIEGVKSILELIDIIKPKYIFLLGIKAFTQLKNNSGESDSFIEYTHVFSNTSIPQHFFL